MIIFDDFLEIASKPIFWATSAAIAATFINFLLFLINRKTFHLLYEKPNIQVAKISLKPRKGDGMGGIAQDSFINLTIINPSSFNNRILRFKLRGIPFGPLITKGNANLKIPQFDLQLMHISLDYGTAIKRDNKLVLITLMDIKKRKIRKIFKLSESN